VDGNVDLGPELEQVVTDLVENGRYPSRDEALREGARLLQERETRRTAVHAKIEQGIADADAGRLYSAEEVREHVLTRIRNASAS